MLTFHIITLFPASFDSYLKESIIGRAIKGKKIRIKFYNPRDFVAGPKGSYKRVDQKAYGGGPGMVMQAEPILRAFAAITRSLPANKGKSRSSNRGSRTIFFSPNGKQFDNKLARVWAKKYQDLILICGRYEGIDARVKKILKAEEVSVGPYILTGGELPAMVVLDTTARQIEGVLGQFGSLEEQRVAASETYTRPETLKYKAKNYRVPKILLSGHRAEIEKWRLKRKSGI